MKLSEYLIHHGITGNHFSKISGVNEKAIYRIIGEKSGMTLRTASLVVQATHGEVGFGDLPIGEVRKHG